MYDYTNTGKLVNGVNMTMSTNLEISPTDKRTFEYGTIACGADTYDGIWTKGKHIFSCDPTLRSECKSHRSNFFRTRWEKYNQLDLLIAMDNNMNKLHSGWIDTWGHTDRAKCLLIFHGSDALVASNGGGFQKWCKRMRGQKYDLRTWHINATHCGAAVWSNYTVSFCFPEESPHKIPNQFNMDKEKAPRSCRNVMRLYGIPPWKYHDICDMTPYKHPIFHNVMGKFRGQLVYHWDGPAGSNPLTEWIYIPNKGIRRIILEEMIQLKGLTSSRYSNVSLQVLTASVEQHVWAAFGELIYPFLFSPLRTTTNPTVSGKRGEKLITRTHQDAIDPQIISSWTWKPPDLSIGSPFYNQRVGNLRKALTTLGKGHEHLFQEGIDILARHRQNYGPNGPTSLTILWWEWPRIHWEELRNGASMNFMETPSPGLTPNQQLKGEALVTAIKFTDELINLKVLRKSTDQDKVVNNFPLFLVPKPGQPGEYRCIADGKAGGQNDVCVGDPCQMTSPDHILPHLYTGGWSGIVDASKFFHMFKTRKDEQRYLGLIHPHTQEMYVYDTLPMGTRNSPGASGRFGAAFIRYLVDSFPIFKGNPVDNSPMAYFTKKVYHPEHGEGRVLVDSNGIPIVLIWMHVDDVLIHGPTLEKLIEALDLLLDTTVKFGLICQPSKTVAPTQNIKFCGFVYNTQSIPQLLIPDNKISRAIAMIDYLTHGCDHSLARLIVSMVVGFLQSLVPATPGNIGASFLQPIYKDLHHLQANDTPGTKQFYYCSMELSLKSQLCLDWWKQALTLGLSKQSQPRDVANIGISWGDGSGTGAGGTINFLTMGSKDTNIDLDIWMGTWDTAGISATSNWKEMCTLKQTLENERKRGGDRVRHRRLIYCTDNMVMCDIFRRGTSKSDSLQKLFLDTKLLELELQCHLLLIHVPGTIMIREGTDGLSRGVPLQRLHKYEGNMILPLLWRPAVPSFPLLSWSQGKLEKAWGSHRDWIFQTDFSDWSRSKILGRNCLWCVSPGFAKQAILQSLYAWVESPTNCGHIFVIPRILQREYGRISKFVLFQGQHTDLPLPFDPLVPFLLFFIPPFDRHLEYSNNRDKERMDSSSPNPIPNWIQKDIDKLQRMSHSV